MIAAQDQHIFRAELLDECDILVDGVRGTGVPFALLALDIGRQHINASVRKVQIPRGAAANVGIELQRLVLRQHAHHVDATVGAIA